MQGGKYYKLLAPVIITVLLVLGCAATFVGYALLQMPVLTLIAGAVFGGGAGVSVYVLFERIKEIESGEEDDLSQY